MLKIPSLQSVLRHENSRKINPGLMKIGTKESFSSWNSKSRRIAPSKGGRSISYVMLLKSNFQLKRWSFDHRSTSIGIERTIFSTLSDFIILGKT